MHNQRFNHICLLQEADTVFINDSSAKSLVDLLFHLWNVRNSEKSVNMFVQLTKPNKALKCHMW